jgi:enamine deaminase RidA (YjgF/YER057c/UK114 family)
MNLLNDLKAPLFVELDVSNVQNYIDTKIDTRLDHINDTLDDKIEALLDNKMPVDSMKCRLTLIKTQIKNRNMSRRLKSSNFKKMN